MRRLSIMLGFILLIAALGAKAEEQEAPAGTQSRKFEFSYTATVKEAPAGVRSVDLWLPVPQDNLHQAISELKFDAPEQPDVAVEPALGNKIAHWRLSAEEARNFKAAMSFVCARKEIAARNIESARELNPAEKARMQEWLKANKLVLVGGKFDEVAENATKGARTPHEIARAAYDFTVNTMKYDKPKDKPGWGTGSTEWACTAKFGNCTDFHALVMSIGRTKGIPVKFEMGFPLPVRDPAKPETSAGAIGGYHCWAKFYLGGVGWVPVDASEAQKNPKLIPYYFGNLTPDRVTFTVGRDVNLVPKQAGEALNYFIYPYAEADGKPMAVEKAFAFKDVP